MELESKRSDRFFPLDDQDLACKSTEASQGVKIFDPFFDIKVESSRISLDVFNTYCSELTKAKIDDLLTSVAVASKRQLMTKDFLIWHLSDLQSDPKVKLLVFGDAVQACSKIQVGFVVAITNAEAVNDGGIKSKNKHASALTFKVTKALQVMLLGLCPDFGYCTDQRKNGGQCTNYVNLSYSKVCMYHVQLEASKFRAARGSLSAISNENPKSLLARSPRKRKRISPPRSGKKSKVMKGESGVSVLPNDSKVASKARLGHKMMQRLNEEEKAQSQTPILTPKKTSTSANNLKDFLNQKTKFDRIKEAVLKAGAPQLGRSVRQGDMADLSSPQKPLKGRSPRKQPISHTSTTSPKRKVHLTFGEDSANYT
ncbi:Protein MCM10-like protein [Aphelenchoides bicaudatus]|nr:Protein MCM10-like protein [Aphelenchoides bicaudatus]